jgi:uncharacterized hydrophobic protein (TIGR00271 family)
MATPQESREKQPALLGWLRIDSRTRPRVYARISDSAASNHLPYWLEIFFAAGIATLGLVLNSPAVIIGAMLISPLMGPIMAAGLALAAGDLYLGIRAGLNLLLSVVAAVAFSSLMVWLLPFNSPTSEILARTNPNLLDLGVALFSGLAGSVAVARSADGSGSGATEVSGVAIAVALMPPLCTVGFGLGSGRNLTIMSGAGLLFLTNLVAIVASAFVVFLLTGVSAAGVDMDGSPSQDRLARLLFNSPLGRRMTAVGHPRWRILMILIILASLAFPLSKALMRVASETVARGAVRSELGRLASADKIVSQQVRIEPGIIVIHVISTDPVPAATVASVRLAIERRSGRTVELSTEAVASERELADLMSRLRKDAPASPVIHTVEEMRKELSQKIQPAILEIWPSKEAPLQDVGLDLGASSIALRVRYQAAVDLAPAAVEVILNSLRARLAAPELTLTLERVPPSRPARTR